MPSNKKKTVRVVALIGLLLTFLVVVDAETQSLETLLAYLKSPNPSTRRDAAHKLGERRVRNQLAVEALVVAARKDEDPDVRAEAVQSLGMIKDFAAVPEMIDALKDPKSDVRSVAIKSLVALYTEHDIGPLVAGQFAPRGLTRLGLHWHPCMPPVQELEFEIDARCVRRELVID